MTRPRERRLEFLLKDSAGWLTGLKEKMVRVEDIVTLAVGELLSAASVLEDIADRCEDDTMMHRELQREAERIQAKADLIKERFSKHFKSGGENGNTS